MLSVVIDLSLPVLFDGFKDTMKAFDGFKNKQQKCMK